MGKRKVLTARGPSDGLQTSRIVVPREVQTREHRIFYVEAGMGAPVVLIHGLGASSRWWFRLFPSLTSANFRVIAPDLPGFGRSAGSFIDIPGAARAVVELADRMRMGQFFVCGHSLGGAIAAQLAADYPDRVRRLVLIASAGIPDRGAARWVIRALQPWSWCPPGFISTLLGDAVRAGPSDMLTGVRQLRRYDVRPVLGRLREIPTLLIWGEKDGLTPVRHAEEIAAALGSVRLERIAGARHLPMVSHPAPVSRLIRTFLDAGMSDRADESIGADR